MLGITESKNQLHIDSRGSLGVAEYQKEIPFLVKRVYYITNVKDPSVVRGGHAHKKLRQLMFCVSGSCKIMFDDGCEKTTVELDCPEKNVIVEPGLWREMYDFSEHATLVVLASDEYDENDYIRDYKSFIEYINAKQ